MGRLFISFLLLSFAATASAFKCYITLAKDECWNDYEVTVTALAPVLNYKKLVSVTVPKGKRWARASFECDPKLEIKFQAEFTPPIWEKDKGKKYNGVRLWWLPKEIKKGDTAWNIPICFPEQFAEVPMPPQATNRCKCSFDGIPPIKP